MTSISEARQVRLTRLFYSLIQQVTGIVYFSFVKNLLFLLKSVSWTAQVKYNTQSVRHRMILLRKSPYPIISFVDCVMNIRPSIELCCLVVFDLSCNGLFRFFFFVLFVFLLLLPLMANKVVCISMCVCHVLDKHINILIYNAVHLLFLLTAQVKYRPNTQSVRHWMILLRKSCFYCIYVIRMCFCHVLDKHINIFMTLFL